MSKPEKIWKWKYSKEPVKNIVEVTSDRIYYEISVIKFYEKKHFFKELP